MTFRTAPFSFFTFHVSVHLFWRLKLTRKGGPVITAAPSFHERSRTILEDVPWPYRNTIIAVGHAVTRSSTPPHRHRRHGQLVCRIHHATPRPMTLFRGLHDTMTSSINHSRRSEERERGVRPLGDTARGGRADRAGSRLSPTCILRGMQWPKRPRRLHARWLAETFMIFCAPNKNESRMLAYTERFLRSGRVIL